MSGGKGDVSGSMSLDLIKPSCKVRVGWEQDGGELDVWVSCDTVHPDTPLPGVDLEWVVDILTRIGQVLPRPASIKLSALRMSTTAADRDCERVVMRKLTARLRHNLPIDVSCVRLESDETKGGATC